MGYPKIFHDNRLDDATPVASTTATGYDVLNLRDFRPYTEWQPTALPATVTVDCAVAKAADYGLVWGNDLHTHGVRAEFRGSTDNFSASDVLLGQVSPPSGGKAGLLAEWTSAEYRYWRKSLEYINLLTYTEEFDNAAWQKTGVTISVDAVTAPDGTTTADKLEEDASTGSHQVTKSSAVTVAIGDVVTASYYAKADERTRVRINLPDAQFDVGSGAIFDLVAKTAADAGVGSASIVELPDGWFRVAYTVTAIAAGTAGVNLQLDNGITSSYTGTTGNGAYIWGAQLEKASAVSDYFKVEAANSGIPTLGIASIGTALEIPQYLREGFDPRGRKPQGVFNRSVAGMPLGRTVQYEKWSQSLTFQSLTWAWVRATWEPAWDAHLQSDPFVFAWDSVSHADELALVTVKDGFATPHKAGSYADLTLALEGLLA